MTGLTCAQNQNSIGTLPPAQVSREAVLGNELWVGTVRRGSISALCTTGEDSEDPAVNEVVEFVHANLCADVHPDGT
jgi:hypothetical protein